jgi:RimJ/RimL family protein N-acetyltransferase
MEIATPRLILREFTAGDLPALAALHADPRSLEFYGPQEIGPDFTRGLLDRFLAWSVESPRLNYQLAIARRENPQEAIGDCGVRLQGCEPGVGEFGLELASGYWGGGFASEASHAILRFAFEDLGLREVHGITVTENTRVQRLVTRLGFTRIETRPGPGWMRERGWSHTEWRLAAAGLGENPRP